MKIISRRAHAIADYLLVVILLSAPTALGMTGTPRTLAYAVAFGHLLLTAASSPQLGAFSVIPLRIHGIVETGVGILLVVAPWLFGFSELARGRIFFPIVGVLIIAISATTNFDRRGAAVPRPPGDRRRWFARKG